MKLIIHEKFLNILVNSIVRDRPEFFGVHTTNFHQEISPPWNKNEPQSGIPSPIDKSEIHYAIKGTKPHVTLPNNGIGLALNLAMSFKRITDSEENTNFSLPISILFRFDPNIKSRTVHRLMLKDGLLQNLKPEGLRHTLSWFISSQINNSSNSEIGIPKKIQLIPDLLNIKVSTPEVTRKRLILKGKLI